MTGIGLISRRYARALAEYSAGLGEETMVYDQLLPLSEHYDYVPLLRETVLSPLVSCSERRDHAGHCGILSGCFSGIAVRPIFISFCIPLLNCTGKGII